MSSVSIKINAQDNSKSGFESAKKSLDSLGKTVKNIQNIVAGLAIIKVAQKVQGLAKDTMAAFEVQQKALANLTHSINQNSNMSAGALKRIVDYTGQLQKSSVYGDEVLQAQATYLSNLKLSEDQIKNTLRAAVDLASSGYGTLESNVAALSKTLAGNSGELGRIIPEVRGLTREQLEAGAAIDIIAEKYKGFGEVLADTFSGKKQSFANVLGDIKEQVGTIFAVFQSGFYDKVLPILNKVNDWLGENMPRIINFFTNLPEIAKIVLEEIKNYFQQLFQPENFASVLSALWTLIVNQFKATINFLVSVLSAIGTTIWEPLKFGFEWLVYGIKTLWQSVIGVFINGLNRLIGPVNKIVNVLAKAAGWLLGKDFGEIELIVDMPDFNEIKKPILDMSKVPAVFQSLTTDWKNLIDETKSNYIEAGKKLWEGGLKDFVGNLGDRISGVLNRELPEAIQRMISPQQTAGSAAADLAPLAGTGRKAGAERSSGQFPIVNIINEVIGGLGSFVEGLLSAVSSFSSIVALMDPVSVIMQGVLDVLSPLIDSLLKPIIGILMILGNTIGKILAPALEMLSPIIELLGKAFVWLYNNGIRHLGNALIFFIVQLQNAIAWVINGIITLINKIPGVNIKWQMEKMSFEDKKLQKIEESDLTKSGDEYLKTTYSGGGASYTAQRDITVNIYIEHSFINGDGREIALRIRQELQSAGALGL